MLTFLIASNSTNLDLGNPDRMYFEMSVLIGVVLCVSFVFSIMVKSFSPAVVALMVSCFCYIFAQVAVNVGGPLAVYEALDRIGVQASSAELEDIEERLRSGATEFTVVSRFDDSCEIVVSYDGSSLITADECLDGRPAVLESELVSSPEKVVKLIEEHVDGVVLTEFDEAVLGRLKSGETVYVLVKSNESLTTSQYAVSYFDTRLKVELPDR